MMSRILLRGTEPVKRPIRRIIALTVVILVIAVTVPASPLAYYLAVRWWNGPALMAALPENPQVRYERGGAAYAQAVAALLPAAIAQVKAVHGRPFARPATVAAYVSEETFMAANGLAAPGPIGATLFNQVTLSPVLFGEQRQRLPLILPHELSHAHLQSWIGLLGYKRLPNWFQEGLAVMVSNGGGAESVSEAEAREAIRSGDRIDVSGADELLNVVTIVFERPPRVPDTQPRIRMAYRQAGLFVAFLRDRDPAGFARMMGAILGGHRVVEAVRAGYGTDVPALWADFVRANEN
jgi:hypothetical protein